MCITEFDEEKFRNQTFEEGKAEGRAEGEAKGRAEGEAKGRAEGEAKGRDEGIFDTLVNLVKIGLLPLSAAAQQYNVSDSEFEELMKAKA